MMDNNVGGNEELDGDAENNIFPDYVNYYIAIQAVSCYQCEYLYYILQEQFLLRGGPIEWLIYGLKSTDPKIQSIAALNEIMAYRPWMINQDTVNNLLKGPNKLTIHEMVKASFILSSYHGLCTFC